MEIIIKFIHIKMWMGGGWIPRHTYCMSVGLPVPHTQTNQLPQMKWLDTIHLIIWKFRKETLKSISFSWFFIEISKNKNGIYIYKKHKYVLVNNFKILQKAFDSNGITQHIEVQKLVKAKYQDNPSPISSQNPYSITPLQPHFNLRFALKNGIKVNKV